MELQVTTLDGKSGGTVTLKDDIFGLEVRQDILHRMVRYQQLKAMSGTHDVKNRSEGNLTGRKFVKQKGSGGARHGDRKAPQFRGGGRAFGPTPRSHAIDLPKKVRALALSLFDQLAKLHKLPINPRPYLEVAGAVDPETGDIVFGDGTVVFRRVTFEEMQQWAG